MIESILSFIKELKNNPKISSFDEATTKQAIILPLLQKLGWNIFNPEEVKPEFTVENRKVDYALRLNQTSELFLEVKQTGTDLEKHQEQLLDYSFRQGVPLAILTNGITWWLYLPKEKGDWKARKFYTIDISQQESDDVAQKFNDLLSKVNVKSGEALKHAESIYKGKLKKKILEETLPEAWNKLISEPDALLVDLISETTEKICGFKPIGEEVTRFLKRHEGQFLLLPEEEISIREPAGSKAEGKDNGKEKKRGVIQAILSLLKEKGVMGGGEVVSAIHKKFPDKTPANIKSVLYKLPKYLTERDAPIQIEKTDKGYRIKPKEKG